MDRMARDFAGRAHFIFVYCREAHPDQFPDHPAHRTFEQKLQHARDMRRRHDTPRTILVDSVDGDVHRQYAGPPNMTWIISASGRVVYKAEWTAASDICRALEELLGLEELKRGGPVRQFFKEAIGYRAQKADGASEAVRGSRQVPEPSAR